MHNKIMIENLRIGDLNCHEQAEVAEELERLSTEGERKDAVIEAARAFCKMIDDDPHCMNDYYPHDIEEALAEFDAVSGRQSDV